MKPITEPGFYEITNEEYHADPSPSKSTFADLKISPLYCFTRRTERTVSKAKQKVFDLGTAIHTMILEPDKLDERVAVPPKKVLSKSGSRAGEKYYAWAKQNADKDIITQGEYDALHRIRANLFENPEHEFAASHFTCGGVVERSGFYICPHTGILKKIRPDFVNNEKIVIDVKSTRSAFAPFFGNDAKKLHYHWSGAMILEGLTELTGHYFQEYRFLAVEKEPPYDLAVYALTPEQLTFARTELLPLYEKFAWCQANNKWPGYPTDLQLLAWNPYKTNVMY